MTIWRRIRSLGQNRAVKQEIDEELRFHIEQRTAENIAAGMTPEEAVREARKRFGNLQNVREECREVRHASFGETLLQDVRFGFRMLRKNPGFTAVAVLTLALGIGANTAVFSAVNASLLRPLPYREPNRIVQVWSRTESNPRIGPSLPDFKDYKEQSRSLAKLAFYRAASFHFTATKEPKEVRGGRVSAEFFDVLGVPPLLGRTFFPEETIPGNDQVVLLAYGIWQRRFGGDPGIIGRSIGLDGKSRVVCGVMPPEFTFPESVEIWAPYGPDSEHVYLKRDDHFDRTIGRLADGVTLSDSRLELGAIAGRLEKQYPGTNRGLTATLVPLSEELVWTFKPALLLLLGAVGAVLLITCANIANLQLVRGVVREKEVAVRSALGAKPGRIVRQFLVESMLLSVMGGVAGLIVAYGTTGLLLSMAPANIPQLQAMRLDGTVLAACLIISMAAGVLSGLLPAVKAARVQITERLKDGGQGTTDGSRRNRLRNALVVGEIAVAVVVLICAGLLLQSFHKLGEVQLGFNPRDLAATRITLPWWKYHETGTDKVFFHDLFERVRMMPGAQDSALVSALPIKDREVRVWFKQVGDPVEPGKEWNAGFIYATPSYFGTMGIPFLRGRNLDDHDTSDSARVVVVDETLARRYFPDADPIGRQVLVEGQGEEPFLIVGIVGGVRQRNATQPPAPQLYFHYRQINEGNMWLIVRGGSRLRGLEKTVAGEVQALDVDQSISPVRTMEEYLGESAQLARFRTFLLGLLALLAVTLAGIGIYSVAAYSVSQRSRELGLRMALGAARGDILKLVMGQNGRLAAVGVLLGIALALNVTRLLGDMLFEVTPTDPASFVVIPALLMLVALSACYLPARRATTVDPMVILRDK